MPLHSAEYLLDSNYSVSGRYNDNYRLSIDADSQSDNELSGANFASRWRVARNTGLSNLDFNLALDAGAYNLDAFNTFDQRANIDYRRNTEKGRWSVGASYSNDSVRFTEQTTSGSGFFEASDSRVALSSVSVSWFSQLTERNSVNWRLSGNLRRNESDRFSDSDNASTSVLWQYTVNERFKWQSQLAYGLLLSDDDIIGLSPLLLDADVLGVNDSGLELERQRCLESDRISIEPPNGIFECRKLYKQDNEQATVSAQAGIYYLLTERLALDVLVGRSIVDTKNTTEFSNINAINAADNAPDRVVKQDRESTTYEASLKYDADTLNYTLSASSSNVANSLGVFTLNTRVAFDVNWQLSNRSRFLWQLSWFEQESSLDGSDALSQREQWRSRFRYSYQLTKQWSLATEYRYLTQQRLDVDKSASSHEAFLTLSWNPDALRWSR